MSHYTEMEVDFETKNEAELVAALEKQYGEGHVEVHDKGTHLIGWHGDDRAKLDSSDPNWAPPCEVVVRRRFVGGSSNDVGFQRLETGKYKAWISDYDKSATMNVSKQGAVAQEYGLLVSEKTLRKQGWQQFTRTTLDDGSVKLTAKNQNQLVKQY